ncbi:hypothetical protein GOP47_0029670 [Adiantum capillus-veneris]|nr:hypothetical protein GOP47_0029670 [Adiantum capillus-veneris]
MLGLSSHNALCSSSSSIDIEGSIPSPTLCRLPCLRQQSVCTRRSSGRQKVQATSTAAALLELVPEVKQESLMYDIPLFDTCKNALVDLIVVGAGPAGLSVAKHASASGLSVCCIDPAPQSIFPNNYGVWVDEFEAMDLSDCLDHTWQSAVVYIDDETKKSLDRPYGRVNRRQLKAKMMECCISNGVLFYEAKALRVSHEAGHSCVVCSDGTSIKAGMVLDATGFSRSLVHYVKPYDPGYQIAYGIVAEVDCHPYDVNQMVFMDWRDSHLRQDPVTRRSNEQLPTFMYAMPFSSTRIFLEETSLVARPGVPFAEIQKRMVKRLAHLGIEVKSIEEDERCVIPMGGPLPDLSQRVVGIGGTAGMVHPSTGYMVAKTLAAAPILANAIVDRLGNKRGSSLNDLSAGVWSDLWPKDKQQQREFFCFGMDVLLSFDLNSTRRFFDAFFDLEPYQWHGFLSSRLSLQELFILGWSLFGHSTNASRLEIVSKGALPMSRMVRNLLTMQD